MSRIRFIKPRFWIFLMSALVLVFSCLYVSQGRFLNGQNEQIRSLQAQYTQKLSENALLKRKIEFAKTDAYIERVAHEELGLLRPEEVRFVSGAQGSQDAK